MAVQDPQEPQKPRVRRIVRIRGEGGEEDSQVNDILERIRTFHRTLLSVTPRVFVTHGIVGLNVLIFLATVVTGAGVLQGGGSNLFALGANSGPLTLGGEPWRLVTSMFLHAGLMHIGFNMWILWDLGQLVERLVGNLGFFLLYMFSGILGSLASVAWRINDLNAASSVGASGAVFGVFGALMGFMILRKDSVPMEILYQIRNSGLAFLVINLVLGFSFPMIDMAAHMGGLGGGFVAGMLLSQPLRLGTRPQRLGRDLLLLMVSLVALTGVYFAIPKHSVEARKMIRTLEKVDHAAYKRMRRLQGQLRRQALKPTALAARLEAEILPQWRTLKRKVQNLATDKLQPELRKAITLRRQYIKLREESTLLYIRIQRATPKDLPKLLTWKQQYKNKQEKISEVIDQIHDQVRRKSRKKDFSRLIDDFQKKN